MHYEESLYYHIYNRGAHSGLIFLEEENYRYLVSLLEKNLVRYEVVIAAYCLMPNHYHLVLRQKRNGSISSFLKTTFNTYTQAMNRRFGTSGTLFQGQARIKQITTAAYCLRVVPYVHLNPVNAKLVKSPDEWRFSNYLEWIDKRKSILLDQELRSSCFAGAGGYENFVSNYQMERERKEISEFLFEE